MRHATDTPEYWEALARTERAFALADRQRRYGSLESIRLHEQNARAADAWAARLRAEVRAIAGPVCPNCDQGKARDGSTCFCQAR